MIFYRKHSRSSLPNLEKIKTMENIFVCLSIEEKWQLLLYDFSIIDEFSVKSLCCEMKGTVSINAIRVSLLLLDETELKLLFFFSILVPDSLLPEPLWFYLCLFQLSLLPVILYLKKSLTIKNLQKALCSLVLSHNDHKRSQNLWDGRMFFFLRCSVHSESSKAHAYSVWIFAGSFLLGDGFSLFESIFCSSWVYYVPVLLSDFLSVVRFLPRFDIRNVIYPWMTRISVSSTTTVLAFVLSSLTDKEMSSRK